MTKLFVVALDRTGVKPFSMSERLRGQLVYFLTPPETPGLPALGEDEFWFAAEDVAKWVDDGVIYLVSPLDTANMTEVELSEEQEQFLEWLQNHQVQHVRIASS